MKVLVLTDAELREVVVVDQAAVKAIENAFTWLAQGKVSMSPIMHIEVSEHQGDVDIKSAYVQGLDRFAVKIGEGFFQNYKLGLPNSPAMMVVLSYRTGMAEAQAVVTCTPSRIPYIKSDWIHPGLHITAMGADLPEKQEFEPDAVKLADMLVCDRKSQSFSMGEFHHAFEAGIISETSPVTELGEITAGLKPGRQTDDQITICDLSGTGVQDTAIADLALQQAAKQGLGIEIEINRG